MAVCGPWFAALPESPPVLALSDRSMARVLDVARSPDADGYGDPPRRTAAAIPITTNVTGHVAAQPTKILAVDSSDDDAIRSLFGTSEQSVGLAKRPLAAMAKSDNIHAFTICLFGGG
jgi:hypothetical protein